MLPDVFIKNDQNLFIKVAQKKINVNFYFSHYSLLVEVSLNLTVFYTKKNMPKFLKFGKNRRTYGNSSQSFSY